jgi:hypothetical protein
VGDAQRGRRRDHVHEAELVHERVQERPILHQMGLRDVHRRVGRFALGRDIRGRRVGTEQGYAAEHGGEERAPIRIHRNLLAPTRGVVAA